MQPLYGHTSADTAYVVDDYPYGRLRCTIKFWLETDARKGARFCSQTTNPKNGRINAPKHSTYAKLAGCMYLDEQGHCQWRGLTEYSSPEDCLKFAQDFPSADFTILRQWLKAALPLAKARAEGKVSLRWSINGKSEPRTEESLKEEQERARVAMGFLQQVVEIVG